MTVNAQTGATNNYSAQFMGGNVGIGTASPSSLLSISGANPQVSLINSSTGGESSILFNANDATKASWYAGHNEGSIGAGNFGFYASGYGQVMTMLGTNGDVGIGTTTPGAQLDVETTTANETAVLGYSNATSGSNTGGYFAANGTGATSNTGLLVGATGGTSNYELYLANLSAGANNYSIYNPSPAKSYFGGSVGIGTTSPGFTLDISGSAHCTASAWSSDQQFKTNVDSIHNVLAIIKQLKPRTYYFDTTNVYGIKFPSKKQYGFIAQDLEQVLPELVTSATKNATLDSAGNIVHPAVTFKSVYYIELIAFLTKGIQEQQQKIDSLTTKTANLDSVNTAQQKAQKQSIDSLRTKTNKQDSINASLQNQVNQLLNCCNHSMQSATNGNSNQQTKSMTTPQNGTIQTDVQLNDAQTIVLEQNVPNPFAEQTTINYSLPNNISKAQMLFYNSQGKLIQSVELVEKDKGQLNVYASDLSNGIYTYTLVVDGKIIETKKMVKQ